MLRGRLGYLAERQQLIAENVANADTPGFLPTDLKPFSFEAQMQLAESFMMASVARRIFGSATSSQRMSPGLWRTVASILLPFV